jgi:cytochrome c-type biogenesis protein CcmF
VMAIVVVEFWKGTRARARIEGEGFALAFLHLVARNRRRWGGYIVHVGIVLIFTAFAASAFDTEVQETILPGESLTVRSAFGHEYELTYEGLSSARSPHMYQWTALMSVRRDGEDDGLISAERRYYIVNEQASSEVGIRSLFYEDLYVILAGIEDMQGTLFGETGEGERATIEIQVNPLVGWIWYGGIVLTIGSLIALWPTEIQRVRATDRVAVEAVTAQGTG